jgi:hypothetical protein
MREYAGESQMNNNLSSDFKQAYRLHFNDAHLACEYSWMPDVPPYATPIFVGQAQEERTLEKHNE